MAQFIKVPSTNKELSLDLYKSKICGCTPGLFPVIQPYILSQSYGKDSRDVTWCHMAQMQTCSEIKEVKRDRENDSRDKRIPEALASQPSQIDKLQAK